MSNIKPIRLKVNPEPTDLSNYVPYSGATLDVNLGNLWIISGEVHIGKVTWDANVGVHFHDAGGINKVLLTTTAEPSSSYSVYLPSSTGTLALVSQIPSMTNVAYVNASNTFTNSNYFQNGIEVGYASHAIGSIVFRNAANAYKTTLNVSTTTNDWSITLPDKGGTVALTSDIPSVPVSSVSNSNSTLTISPTTGAVIASLNLAHANSWTANQTIHGVSLIVDSASTVTTITATSASLILCATSGSVNSPYISFSVTDNSIIGKIYQDGTTGYLAYDFGSGMVAALSLDGYGMFARVGIGNGTTPPTVALDVVGAIKASTTITATTTLSGNIVNSTTTMSCTRIGIGGAADATIPVSIVGDTKTTGIIRSFTGTTEVGAFQSTDTANVMRGRNGYYDGSNWQRIDTTKYSVQTNMFADTNYSKYEIYTNSPHANPMGVSNPWVLRFEVNAYGNVVIGNAALATNVNDGFLYIESCAGTPTGTPRTYTGRIAIVYDSSNNYIYVYNGAWKKVLLA